MSDETLFAQVLAPKNRADPYPLYARMRETPVSRQADGSYLVSTQAALRSLIFDPRLSSEDLPPSRRPATGNPPTDWILNPIRNRVVNAHRPLIFRVPPDHDTLRGIVMKEFTIARVRDSHAKVATLVDALIDKCRGRDTVCLVDDLSCPLPVAVICELLGVPEADERQFHAWATRRATALEPDARHDEAGRREIAATFDAISDYMRRLIREKRRHPADDMLRGLTARGGRGRPAMGDIDLISTAILLLVAGRETTVNLITNGMLTLLRHPDELEKLKADPKRAPRVIEEILRHEPPVHFRTRRALDDIDVEGTTIPAGSSVVLMLAAGNRDPARFTQPDRFDPDRNDNQHFGFGGGLHYCVGAPLARVEAEIALVTLCQRLVAPRLLDDPPPYRAGASLRGPKNLGIAIAGIA
ncbi:MAG: cytochrome P450 [Methylobacterium sp.]|uniref:cytochrome P450 n=1 Tax=Methylobacterium sp. TaxID=409 RepID=UPI000FAE5B87|nr:cytochrome P450 [Methylobacterium sp.]RUP14209.1 MAG: cytochrome P450 [Methylobacterium sp.]